MLRKETTKRSATTIPNILSIFMLIFYLSSHQVPQRSSWLVSNHAASCVDGRDLCDVVLVPWSAFGCLCRKLMLSKVSTSKRQCQWQNNVSQQTEGVFSMSSGTGDTLSAKNNRKMVDLVASVAVKCRGKTFLLSVVPSWHPRPPHARTILSSPVVVVVVVVEASSSRLSQE